MVKKSETILKLLRVPMLGRQRKQKSCGRSAPFHMPVTERKSVFHGIGQILWMNAVFHGTRLLDGSLVVTPLRDNRSEASRQVARGTGPCQSPY
jgi:hypothetical protein